MSLCRSICLFLLVLAAVAPVTPSSTGPHRTGTVLRVDGGAPEPPPIPIPWERRA
jgi:hypothetical protein